MIPGRAFWLGVAIALALTLSAPARPGWAGGPGVDSPDLAQMYEQTVQQLAAVTGPTPPIGARPDPIAVAGQVEALDTRAILLKLARSDEAGALATVRAVQPAAEVQALAIVSGGITLEDLLDKARQILPDALGPDGLRVPVVVAEGARLLIGPGQTLRLDRSQGTFLANFGQLDVTHGAIVAAGPPSSVAPHFAPFVVTAGQGVLSVKGGYFEGLGFGSGATFAGVSVVVSGLFRPAVPSRVEDAVMRNVGSLAFIGAGGPSVERTTFVEMRGPALVLRGTLRADVSEVTVIGGAGRAMVHLTESAIGTRISDTTLLRARQTGLLIEAASHGTSVEDTVIWRPRHHGVLATASDCVSLSGMRLASARHGGVVLRGARASRVTDSTFVGSGHAGLMIGGLPEGAETRIEGNLFRGNRSGIETASPGRLLLRGNDFSDQFPRFLDGDIEVQTPAILRDLMGRTAITLIAGGTTDRLAPLSHCPASEDL